MIIMNVKGHQNHSHSGAGRDPWALQDSNKEWWHVCLPVKAALLCGKSMNSLQYTKTASFEIMQFLVIF